MEREDTLFYACEKQNLILELNQGVEEVHMRQGELMRAWSHVSN